MYCTFQFFIFFWWHFILTQVSLVLTEHTYWAKDIIFLLTEHEEIGMQAWLSAYHDSPTQCKLHFIRLKWMDILTTRNCERYLVA